jgi:acyl-CoA synthetase (AMP-forming)/AMP-acid ligase II
MASTASLAAPSTRLNVADRLATWASKLPTRIAVSVNCREAARQTQHDPPLVHFQGRHRGRSGASYLDISFSDLDENATRIARGLVHWGIPPGTRIALLVRPGIDFVTLVFALLRAGAVIVLIDPGLGRRNLVRSLGEAEPEGIIGNPLVQAIRSLKRRRFPRAKWNVTVGRRWFWRGPALGEVIARGWSNETRLPDTHADDPAAIIFTSGSTGPAKGVLYTHRMFDTQVAEIQSMYGIEPGGIDLSCFPLFALFNSAMGVTTVFPDMDFSRPAAADPQKLLAAANDWQVTQAFASPAVWHIVGKYCAKTGQRIPTLRQVISCGAPVPADVLRRALACVAGDARMHTPYGATECLPVATIEAAEVLNETAQRTEEGAGVCVGRKFESIEWRVIGITDEPIDSIDEAEELPRGEIGELIVRGPQASPCYVTQTHYNALAKIPERAGACTHPRVACNSHGGEDAPARFPVEDESSDWHRTGDVGYIDDAGRFWYCGRKSHRVETVNGVLYTEAVEAIFNSHRHIERTALVGIGRRGQQTPVVVFQQERTTSLSSGHREASSGATALLVDELRKLAARYDMTRTISVFLPCTSLPVDVRHNAKINRELLAIWAATRITP